MIKAIQHKQKNKIWTRKVRSTSVVSTQKEITQDDIVLMFRADGITRHYYITSGSGWCFVVLFQTADWFLNSLSSST